MGVSAAAVMSSLFTSTAVAGTAAATGVGAGGALVAGAGTAAAAAGAGTAITGLTGLGSAIATGATSLLGAKLAGKGPSVKSPTAMPTPDDAAVLAAKRAQVAEMQTRSGRASTLLSDGAKLGG